MNKIFVFVGLFAVCNAASLHVVPAGDTIYHHPAVSVYRAAYAPAFSPVVRSVDLSSDAVAAESPSVALAAAPAVVSSIVPSAVATTVSDAELADFEAYKVKNSFQFLMKVILQMISKIFNSFRKTGKIRKVLPITNRRSLPPQSLFRFKNQSWNTQ